MNMKRRLLLSFILLIFTVSFTACKKNGAGDAPTPTAEPEITVTAVLTDAPVNAPTVVVPEVSPTEAAMEDPNEGQMAAPTDTVTEAVTKEPEKQQDIYDEKIKIAVIDTGISSSVISADSILPGKNYICPEHDTEDRIGHGTALSAFIVGSGPARMEGYCPEALLVPLVYADMTEETEQEAETDEDASMVQVMGEPALVAEAVRDAVDEFDCRIILISSGTRKDDSELREAVKYAREQEVLVVSCSGNTFSDEEEIFYPGAYEEVLCVGSVNEDGEAAYFSQENSYVDVWEIGTDLRLATLKGTRIRGEGTSYSAAIVAGKAAQILTENNGLTVDGLIDMIVGNTSAEPK